MLTRALRAHDFKLGIRVRDSKPRALDSSTGCTKSSPDSGEKTPIDSEEVQTPIESSQLSTFEVKEEEINLRPMTNTSKVNTNEDNTSMVAW